MKNAYETGTNKKREWRARLHELATTGEKTFATRGPIYAVTYQRLSYVDDDRRSWADARYLLATLDLDEAIREAEEIDLTAGGERVAINRYVPMVESYPDDPAIVGVLFTPAEDDPEPEISWWHTLIATKRGGEPVIME